MAPTVSCVLDIVASGLDDLRPGHARDSVLSDYGRALAYDGRMAEALAVSTQIANERSRNQVLEVLAGLQATAGATPDATVLDESMSAEDRAVRFAMLAESAFGRETMAEARALLDRALAAAVEVEAATSAPYGHYRLASALELAGDHDAAAARARAIADPSNSAITLIELARRRAGDGDMAAARALMSEAAALREAMPADKRYLPLSRAAEFWMRNGETDRALALARGAESDRVREGVLRSLVDVAARLGDWDLAEALAEEGQAETVLANIYASCALSVASRDVAETNSCLPRAHELAEGLHARLASLPERARYDVDSAIVTLAMAESVTGNPDIVRGLMTKLSDEQSRRHARFMIINVQTGRDTPLAMLMALSLEAPGDRMEALARIARFLAADAVK